MLKNAAIVFDIETHYGVDYNRVGNPFAEKADLVCCGYLTTDNLRIVLDARKACDVVTDTFYCFRFLFPLWFLSLFRYAVIIEDDIPDTIYDYKYIVGQNVKFDMLWCLHRKGVDKFLDWVAAGGQLVCTAFSHYKLSGHIDSGKLSKLDRLAPLYGGYHKVDEIKALWDQGVQTRDIHRDLLNYYLTYDVYNTYLIYQKTEEVINGNKLATMFKHQRGFMCLTLLYEYYGIYVNKERATSLHNTTLCERDTLRKEVDILLEKAYPDTWQKLDIDSPQHLSAAVYGGVVKERVRIPKPSKTGETHYKGGEKAGQLRTVWGIAEINFSGMGIILEEKRIPTATPGVYSVSHSVFSWYMDHPFIAAISKYRKCCKLLSMYLAPDSMIMTSIHPDECIRSSFGHSLVATGRLSSSSPPLQNADNDSDFKQIFSSRFGKEGFILEADFSQLENLTQAENSKDPNLINDIISGVDLHSKRAASIEGESYEEFYRKYQLAEAGDKTYTEYKVKRKAVKSPSFAYAYGAGLAKLIESTGLTEEAVRAFIKVNNELYGVSVQFFKTLYDVLITKAVPSTLKSSHGHTLFKTVWRNVFGCPVGFLQSESPAWQVHARLVNKLGEHHPYMTQVEKAKKANNLDLLYPIHTDALPYLQMFTSFTPTKFKNYPNQNLGGDIAAITGCLFLYKLLPYIKARTILPILHTHDSYAFDCKDAEAVDTLKKVVQDISTHLTSYMNNAFSIKLLMPYRLECKVGKTLKECK